MITRRKFESAEVGIKVADSAVSGLPYFDVRAICHGVDVSLQGYCVSVGSFSHYIKEPGRMKELRCFAFCLNELKGIGIPAKFVFVCVDE
jgi:hypothetical protein